MKNETSVTYKTQTDVPLPAGAGGGSYPDKPKTEGLKTRGNGAATKGIIARGPMG